MSSPQTPTTARRQSPISTPTSSRDGASPAPLTPRSKVRAMLAAIDDDASDEENTKPKANVNAAKPGIIHTALTSERRKSCFDQDIGEPESSDDDAEDDGFVSRPKGKLARKMQVDNAAQIGDLEKECASDEDNAYERIKKQLKERQISKPMAGEEKRSHSNISSIEEDGDSQSVRSTKDHTHTTPDRCASRAASQQPESNSPAHSATSNDGTLQKSMSPRLNDDSDSDLPEDPHSNPRILALAEQARQERQAKEAEAIRERKQREDRLRELAGAESDESDEEDTHNPDSESAIENRLTQHVRPTRKASKKALEDMNRETQRMSRNMQLTHEARTKKKITKQSLFARFNYNPAGSLGDEPVTSGSGAHSSSTIVSDADRHYSTAPSSPPLTGNAPGELDEEAKDVPGEVSAPNGAAWPVDDADLPGFDEVLAEKSKEPKGSAETNDRQTYPGVGRPTKGKGKAKAVESKFGTAMNKNNGASRRIRIKQPLPYSHRYESDSELEIVPTSKARAALLEHVHDGKGTQPHALRVQRALARLNDLEDKTNKANSSVTAAQMHANLQRDARQQAAQARAQHLEELKRKGIVVQTAEERAKDDATIEDMIEKARKETEEISKREKAAAKKAGNQGFAIDVLDSDEDDEDAEWSEDDEVVEYSGSEEEVESQEAEMEDDEECEQSVDEGDTHDDHHDLKLTSTEVSEHTVSERGSPSLVTQDPDYNRSETMNALIRSADEEQEMSMTPAEIQNPFATNKSFVPGLPGPGGISLGLTQIFAGTMADEQTQQAYSAAKSQVGRQDSLDFLRQLPAISLPCLEQSLDQGVQDIVKDSQPLQSQTNSARGAEDAARSQTSLPCSQLDSQHDISEDPLYLSYASATQVSEFPDPTQDVGFAASKPFPSRFMQSPPATVDTVLIEKENMSTMQRSLALVIGEDDENEQNSDSDIKSNLRNSASAFEVMRKAARKPSADAQFDRKKSKAKEMVEEQAEESEDEYAGLGGASEDDSADEEAEAEMKDMLDDRELDVDEVDLAALMADKDRADDKKQIEKIYRDVTTGVLRRKRGTDLDLSDSDYDEDARQRMKRRKEMRLRKALLADEHVEKIATNPKKSAFFQSIEDRDKVEGIDFLDEPPHEVLVPDSQEDHSRRESSSAVQPSSPSKRSKRRLTLEDSGNEENRPPPHLRRPTKAKKLTTTDDIRECLASLIAPPNAITTHDAADDSEENNEGEEEIDSSEPSTTPSTNNPFAHPALIRSKTQVIDRLALRRTSNATTSSTTTTQTRLAFHDSTTTSGTSSFRVPALLRRATTSHLVSAGAAADVVVNGKNEESSSTTVLIKKAGSKKSCSINWYHAREQQRKAVEENGRKGRDGKIVKMGRERGALLGGLFGGGKFE